MTKGAKAPFYFLRAATLAALRLAIASQAPFGYSTTLSYSTITMLETEVR